MRHPSRLLRRTWQAFVLIGLFALCCGGTAEAQVRIKDIAAFEGVRENLLVGYGLVVGLNGTGDNFSNSAFTEQSMIGMLERLGVNVRDKSFKPKNVAAVLVTATLPPFSRHGGRIDVTVSAIGDAKSLEGGMLLVTPLMGADGEVYAVGQGPVAISGFNAEGDATKVTRGVPTAGRIANGALVEREIGFELDQMASLRVTLHNPDFTTASRIAQAINQRVGGPAARALDPATVEMQVPGSYQGDVARLLTDI